MQDPTVQEAVAAPHSPAPTMRRLAALSLSVFAVLVLVTLAALLGGSAVLRQAMETVSRDTRSATIASEIEATALMHQRLSNLHVVTGEAGIARERRNAAARVRTLIEEAEGLVGAVEEQHVLDAVAADFDRYLERRVAAESASGQLAEVVQAARPALHDVLVDLRTLRELNDAQVQRARARALRMNRLATWVGVSGSLLLIAGLAAVAWGTRRYLVRPVVALHQAMGEFRGGALDARAGGGGVREVDELARMFDEMAESLAQQRQAQLTFLAGVAHDLKSPLSTLKTGMYILAHEPSELRRADTRATLDHQLDLLNRMVDDLLDAARIEAGNLELRFTSFDLRRLVQDVVKLYVPAAPDHHLTARVPETAVNIEVDGLRIEQVLRNLVSNAIKYSPDGGPVDVAVEPVDGYVTLSVSDRGIGMSREEQVDIFLPFRRRNLATVPGAGLGLSVVRRIVAAHGGDIEVRSEPGTGSTFTVRLPKRRDMSLDRGRP